MFDKPTPFWADAFVGIERHDHPEACVCRLYRQQVARGPGQFEAGWHRALPVRRLQAGRHGAGQTQSRLSRPQPAVFRHAGDQGRWRCGVGRARGAADRRIRLRLEHAGGGRNPDSGSRLAATARSIFTRPATSNSSLLKSPIPAVEVDGERASLKTKHPLFSRPGGAPGHQPVDRSRPRSRNSSMAAPRSPRPTS